jgi:putative DNA primase/helicase
LTSTISTPATRGAALAWHDAGFCVVPAADDGSKRPGVGAWKTYQREQFPREALANGSYPGIGLVCGAVSGGLEMLELEGRAIAEGAFETVAASAAAANLGDLWDRVTKTDGAYLELTPSGGVHILYRLADAPVPGNTKLANRPARVDELTDDESALVAKGRTVVRGLAETRGDGGFVIVAPSAGTTHPTGKPWALAVGRPGQVPTITAAEREQLHDLFRQLDQMPQRPAQPAPPETILRGVEPQTGPLRRNDGPGLSPGDDFAARTEWPAILEPAGWHVHYQAEGITYWTRPGKDTGTSATTNANGTDRLYVHTSSTEFDPQESYSKFGAYAVLNFAGDHSAAARDLAARGHGSPPPGSTWPLATPPPAWFTAPVLGNSRRNDGGGPGRLPPPSSPMAVARVLEPELRVGADFTLRNWRGGWWQWHTSHWAEIEPLALRKRLYVWTEHAVFMTTTKNGPEDRSWSPDQKKVANLADALASIVLLDRNVQVPSWLSAGHEDTGAVVACRNGLLKLDGRVLMPHDPGYFNLVAVPFDYDAAATEPREWLKFLATLWPGGGDGQVAALQEWFGYVISGRTDMQKIFAIIGPPRSGKGTIATVLTALAGAANVAGPTLASLAMQFGLQPLLGKSLALISDARIGRSADTAIIVERLLTISGEDVLSIDRKHKEAWEGRIPARLMLLSNELPRFSDSSGTIATRFVVAETVTSFLGREDRALRARLMAELPGILNWALAGLERLLAQGRFTDTAVSVEAVEIMRLTASPYAPFVDEQCVVGPQYEVAVDALWQAWKLWCFNNDREKAGVKQWLGRDLKSVVPGLHVVQPRDPDTRKQYRAYRGLGLRVDYPVAARALDEAADTRKALPDTRKFEPEARKQDPLWPGETRTDTDGHAHLPVNTYGSKNENTANTPIELQWVGARVSALHPEAAAESPPTEPAAPVPPTPDATDPNFCSRCSKPFPDVAWLPCDQCSARHHARGRGGHGPTCQTCLIERTATT